MVGLIMQRGFPVYAGGRFAVSCECDARESRLIINAWHSHSYASFPMLFALRLPPSTEGEIKVCMSC